MQGFPPPAPWLWEVMTGLTGSEEKNHPNPAMDRGYSWNEDTEEQKKHRPTASLPSWRIHPLLVLPRRDPAGRLRCARVPPVPGPRDIGEPGRDRLFWCDVKPKQMLFVCCCRRLSSQPGPSLGANAPPCIAKGCLNTAVSKYLIIAMCSASRAAIAPPPGVGHLR